MHGLRATPEASRKLLVQLLIYEEVDQAPLPVDRQHDDVDSRADAEQGHSIVLREVPVLDPQRGRHRQRDRAGVA